MNALLASSDSILTITPSGLVLIGVLALLLKSKKVDDRYERYERGRSKFPFPPDHDFPNVNASNGDDLGLDEYEAAARAVLGEAYYDDDYDSIRRRNRRPRKSNLDNADSAEEDNR